MKQNQLYKQGMLFAATLLVEQAEGKNSFGGFGEGVFGLNAGSHSSFFVM